MQRGFAPRSSMRIEGLLVKKRIKESSLLKTLQNGQLLSMSTWKKLTVNQTKTRTAGTRCSGSFVENHPFRLKRSRKAQRKGIGSLRHGSPVGARACSRRPAPRYGDVGHVVTATGSRTRTGDADNKSGGGGRSATLSSQFPVNGLERSLRGRRFA